MKPPLRKNTGLAGLCLFIAASSAQAATFHIDFSFAGLDSVQQSYFTQAADFWGSVITGYNGSVTDSRITGVSINASAASMDGVGGILGSAGPQTLWGGPGWHTGGYALAKTGVMQYDTADISNMIGNGTFTAVIEHEMAHVLGFGTLWEANHLYTAGSGQYAGAYGLAAWKNEFKQASAAYVPVELDGGTGTANGHWNEVANGAANVGIADSQGRDMKYELMTGWLNSPAFLSNTTVQSFRDLGYSVTAVPLPASVWLFGSALLSILGFSSGKRRA